MKKLLILAASVSTLVLSSCYIDPYYGGSVGYSSYGSSGSYSSSVFISTGDSRWAYDPYRYCYYDRVRGSYYDPYLYGYYPVGYLPTPILGCPHPGGWSGHGYCPPPSRITVRNLSRYDDRLSNYESANYHWSRKVSSGGTPSWMSSSQRSQLQQRASQNYQAPATPSAQGNGWMNGGFNRGNSSSMNQRPSSFSGFGGSNQAQPQTQSPTLINEALQTQPRPSNGGMFGGLDRSGRGASPRIDSSPQRQESITSIETPQIREQPRQTRSTNSGWKGSQKSDDGPSPFSGGDDSGSRGGLRRFQR
ncbi:MAG: hypothetical protein CAK88_07690 [Verrucomicrobiia bacterium AMD-G2]|nr:MAG: hypothetical protein CAK88_07690 [Verrucomicrobiae bacterium AMD-G2]